MGQFFTRANIESFFNSQSGSGSPQIDPEPIVQSVNYDEMFERLRTAVMESPFGGMLVCSEGSRRWNHCENRFATT